MIFGISMKRQFITILTAFLITTAFFACTKEFSIEGIRFDPIPEQTLENVTIQGIVLDETGKPVPDAEIVAGMDRTQTDRYGIFRLEDALINVNGGMVTVQKSGYFTGSRSILYETSSTNFMRIRLVKKVLVGDISESGGILNVDDAKLEFPSNAFMVSSTKAPYTGKAKVYAAFLPGNNLDILDEMPGNLYGIRTDSTFAGLETLGMMIVEIEGSAGQPLNLAEGKEAVMDIPAMTDAPGIVPMWHFDEDAGFWREEGEALKTSGRLVARVKHFSTWNWDLPYKVVKMKATFTTPEGTPLQNYRIIIKRTNVTDNTKLSVQAITDSTGTIRGPLPANEVVTLSIVGSCGENIFSKSIGPVGMDTDFGNMQVSIPNYNWVTVSGRLVDCNDQPVKKGFFTLLTEYRVYRAGVDSIGRFTLKFLNCNNISAGDATGYDAISNREGDILPILLSTPNTNVGDIKICGAVVQNQYIDYKIDNTPYVLSTPIDSVGATYSGNKLLIGGMSPDRRTFIMFECQTDGSLGAKKLVYFYSSALKEVNPNNADVNITKWDVNGWVEGNIKATMIRYDSFQSVKNVLVDLNFSVRRQ
jgi:hypothetical protein